MPDSVLLDTIAPTVSWMTSAKAVPLTVIASASRVPSMSALPDISSVAASNSPVSVTLRNPVMSELASTATALEATTVPTVVPSKRLISAVVSVAPSNKPSSDSVTFTLPIAKLVPVIVVPVIVVPVMAAAVFAPITMPSAEPPSMSGVLMSGVVITGDTSVLLVRFCVPVRVATVASIFTVRVLPLPTVDMPVPPAMFKTSVLRSMLRGPPESP